MEVHLHARQRAVDTADQFRYLFGGDDQRRRHQGVVADDRGA
jgi:hypothetical protein